MPTPAYTYRIPPEVKDPFNARRAALGLSDIAALLAAIRLWTGHDDGTLRESALAVKTLRAELAEARAEIDRLAAELARATGAPVPAGNRFAGAVEAEQALAAYLAAATPAFPATVRGAVIEIGYAYSRDHVQRLLIDMAGSGYLVRQALGEYLPAPGMDMDRGVQEARREASKSGTVRRTVSRRAARQDPEAAPVPAVPAGDATAPSKVKNAAREKARNTPGAVSRPPVAASKQKAAAAVRAARAAGHDVRTASELAAVPTAVFRPGPGPDPDCLHPKVRVKGACPDCGAWVASKR